MDIIIILLILVILAIIGYLIYKQFFDTSQRQIFRRHNSSRDDDSFRFIQKHSRFSSSGGCQCGGMKKINY